MARDADCKSPEQITELLQAWGRGDRTAFDQLAPVIYTELRRLARRYMSRERPDHTLEPTALVHEAYMRLADFRSLHWKSRIHFFALSAQVMRRVLVDFARSRVRRKRSGAAQRISLDGLVHFGAAHDAAMLVLDDALNALSAEDPRKCEVVEMKFFGGLSIDEISHSLAVSPETVQRDWKLAKLWLLRYMTASGNSGIK